MRIVRNYVMNYVMGVVELLKWANVCQCVLADRWQLR